MISALNRSSNSRRRTINELIDEHKVVLHALLVDLAEVRLGNPIEAIKILEHKSSVGIGSVRKAFRLAWSGAILVRRTWSPQRDRGC
jgi:hypothetical protein